MSKLTRKLDGSIPTEEELKKTLALNAKNNIVAAVAHLREARSLLVGVRVRPLRLGLSHLDIGIIAELIEAQIGDPEDLRDDWPHAITELREAARIC